MPERSTSPRAGSAQPIDARALAEALGRLSTDLPRASEALVALLRNADEAQRLELHRRLEQRAARGGAAASTLLRIVAEDAWRVGKRATAERAARAAIRSAEARGDEDQLAASLVVRAHHLHLQDRAEEAHALAVRALDAVRERTPDLECQVHVLLASIASHSLAPDAPRHARRAVRIARERERPELLARALAQLGIALVERGVHEEAREVLREAREAVRRRGDRESECRVEVYLSMLELDAGRPLLAQKHLAAAARVGDRSRIASGIVAGSSGVVHLVRGHHAAAARELAQADVLLDDLDHRLARATFLAFWGAADVAAGRLREAKARFDEASALVAASGPESYPRAVVQALATVLGADVVAAHEVLQRVESSAAFEGWADVRVACRVARGVLRGGAPAPTDRVGLFVGPSASWFSLDGARSVSLARRPTLRRILAELVATGRPVPGDTLVARIWPEDRKLPLRLLRTRLHVSIAALRRLGLRNVLVHDGRAYRLEGPVELVEEEGAG